MSKGKCPNPCPPTPSTVKQQQVASLVLLVPPGFSTGFHAKDLIVYKTFENMIERKGAHIYLKKFSSVKDLNM